MNAPLRFHPRTAQSGYADLVQDALVDPSLYTDPQIFEAEMERIFSQTWIWVAHVSELPKPGDFRSTFVGRNPVIVVRDRQQNIHVLENRCRHRGATVCEKTRGNATGFTCPYHSWSYGLDGKLRGLPYADGYEDVIEKSDLPLKSLKVGVYGGMIFASYNQDVEPLEDFLGNARHWIDLFMKQGAGFPVKTQGEHKFSFKGNWKIQLENTTDGYHFPVVHKTFLQSVDARNLGHAVVHDRRGIDHAIAGQRPQRDGDGARARRSRYRRRHRAIAGALRATSPKHWREDYPPEQVRRIVRSLHGAGFNLNLFPNVAMSMSFFRVLRPVAVDETEIRHVALGMDGGPEIANRERLRIHEHFQGPFGFGSPDDAEAWERVQAGAHAGRDVPILVNRGLNREWQDQNGDKVSHSTDETGMREAYAMWKRMMSK